MRIAVISDIHGNIEALEAVMADIEKKECSKIFVLGDYAMAGPEPDSVVDFFMKRQSDVKYSMIQGNTDFMIANFNNELYLSLKEKAPVMAEALQDDSTLLNPIQKDFLKNLPLQKEVEEENVKFLLVHGSPRKNNEDILPNTPLEEVEKMLTNVDANVVLCGHTHIPCGFQTNSKKTVVNVGSVGRSFFKQEENSYPKACYLIIDINNGNCEYQHQFVTYNNEKASQKLVSRKFDGSEKLAETLLNPEIRHF